MADFLKALLLKVSKNPWFLFWIVFPEVQLRRTMLVHTKIVKCIKEDLGKFAEIRGDYSFSIYAKFPRCIRDPAKNRWWNYFCTSGLLRGNNKDSRTTSVTWFYDWISESLECFTLWNSWWIHRNLYSLL